jgi:hypothetical protein
VADRYDAWAAQVGYPSANHYIVTGYKDGEHSIGYHFDKPKSIREESLITVVKTGSHARPFQLRHRVALEKLPGEDDKAFKERLGHAQNTEPPFFDRTLEPGTAIVMTLEANLMTQHAVPKVEEAGPSGSLVFRTIDEVVPFDRALAAVSKRQREGDESD